MLTQNVPTFDINNRRYLGSKYKLLDFIVDIVGRHCRDCKSFCDLFAGTGTVATAFNERYKVITNDILACNVYAHQAFLGNGSFDLDLLSQLISSYNNLSPEEIDDNYYSSNFKDTFLSVDNLKKVGHVRDDIDRLYSQNSINDKEKAILITSLIYAVDKIANTVGHYDAFRLNGELDKELILGLPNINQQYNINNLIFNEDATSLVKQISADIVYIDPPYNSRQYCDSYHFLENLAVNSKPSVHGVARKMDRSHLKSQFCTAKALVAFEELVKNIDAKYILLSYNSTGDKANSRSNAKLKDDDILRVLRKKGEVTIEERDFKPFSTGKSDIQGLTERVFVCSINTTNNPKSCGSQNRHPVVKNKNSDMNAQSPLNYTGGKFRLLNQIQPRLPSNSAYFYDVFCGGANVGINSNADKINCIDINPYIINLFNTLKKMQFDDVLAAIEANIANYGFSDTYTHGYDYYQCLSDNGVGSFNKAAFLSARSDFNKNQDDALLFLTLVIFSFNNQFRFNSKGEFNIPVGKRDFNQSMRKKLKHFMEKLHQKPIDFIQSDFRSLDIDRLKLEKAFLYLDPPYILGTATYNENGGWREEDENDLLTFLDECHRAGIKFALSNVIKHKGKCHNLLIDWAGSLDLTQHNLNKTYSNASYHGKNKDKQTQEVLITNFN